MPIVELPSIKLKKPELISKEDVGSGRLAHYSITHVDGQKDHGLVPRVVAKEWEKVGIEESPLSIVLGRLIPRKDKKLASVRIKYGPNEIVNFLIAPQMAQKWALMGAGERFERLYKDYHERAMRKNV